MKRLSVDSILQLMLEVDDTVPLRIEDDSGEFYTFNVSRAKYAKAIKDKTFARQLLMSHKNAIHKQSTNALSTLEHGSSCVQDLVELHLCDSNDNNKEYILLVSKTDYERATNNVLYAAELLENHKSKNKEKQRHDLTSTCSPSNSKAIINKQSSNILSTSEHGSLREAEQLIQLKLIDGNDDKQYNLLVTKTEYERAGSDIQMHTILYDTNSDIHTIREIKSETLVKTFIWAQWDATNQVLYHIHHKKAQTSVFSEDAIEKPHKPPCATPTLSGLQFHDDLPHETVLNIPLNLPQSPSSDNCGTYEDDVIPLRIHDCSLDLIVISDYKGAVCVCHHYLYRPVQPPQHVLDSALSDSNTVHFAYSVTVLHHSCVIHCVVPGIPWTRAKLMRPTFTLYGDSHMVVFVQDFFTHLLEIGLHHQPCCHILSGPLTNVPSHSSYLVPLLNLSDSSDVKTKYSVNAEANISLNSNSTNILTIDLPTLDLVTLTVPTTFLVDVFKKETSTEVRLGILHYFLCHKNDLETVAELISAVAEKPRSLDIVKIMQEFLIGDMLYAAQLLENYKTKNQEKRRHTSTSTNLTAQSTYSAHASTSSNNIVKPVNINDCDNQENVEDTENLDLSMCNKDSRCTWDKNQTKLLLSLYKEYESKLREGKISHRKFWIIISNQLKLKGYTFTSNQCKFKLDSLKRKYKVIVDHNSQSGNDRKTCDEFELLEDLFAKKPWVKPLSIAGSNISMDDMDQPSESNQTCKRQKLAVHEATIKYMNDWAEDKKLRREATKQYREKKLELFGNLVDSLQPK